MGLALIIILVLLMAGIYWLRRHPEYVQRWVARRLARHLQRQAEEAMRRNAESRQQQQPKQKQRRRRSRSYGPHEPIIPPEYAQDVEFTETRSYRSDTTVHADGGKVNIDAESQVSDVEWVDISYSDKKKEKR